METRREEDSLDWMETLRSLRDELRSFKVDNENITKLTREKKK